MNKEVKTIPEMAPSTSNYRGPGLLFVKHQQVIPRALWHPCPPTCLLWCKPGPPLSSRPSFSSCPQTPLLWDYLGDSLFLPNIPPAQCRRKCFCVDWKLDFLEDVTNLIVISSERGGSCVVLDPRCALSTAPPSPREAASLSVSMLLRRTASPLLVTNDLGHVLTLLMASLLRSMWFPATPFGHRPRKCSF